ISLRFGRVRFRLVEQSRVEILTPSAGLEPVLPGLLVGEVFVSRSGLTGLKMTAGQLRVTPVGAPAQVLLAGREPVFLPKPPSVGYVSWPMFYAQNSGRPSAPTQARPPVTQAQPQDALAGEEEALEGTAFGMSETTVTALSAVGLGGVIAGGVGLGVSSGGGGHASPPPATPVGP